jgi:hypothetical protein
MLEQEFKWYLHNQNDLVKIYNGKVLVIKDEQVKGAYDSIPDAITNATKQYELGTFLIQKCSPGKEDYTQTFHSRVSFTQ